jgi:aspartate aminotransferase
MPKPLSKLVSMVKASTTIAIDSMYKRMKAEGIDVVGFGAGEPDFNTPDNIKQAGIKAIEDNYTRYTPSSGIEALRQAVCDRLKADCGLVYTPSQIVVSNGAKQSLYLALKAITNPGDEIVLPAPYWVSYLEMIRMTGGTPVIVNTNKTTAWKMTAEMLKAAITPKTKALILNSPSNPSGVVYTEEELEAIARVVVEADIYVISDEIYYKLIYNGCKFRSFASFGEEVKQNTIVVNGVSKSYAMTGWRIGYTAANDDISKLIGNYQSHASSAPNSIAQIAATEALAGPQDNVVLMRKEFQARRDYFVERLRKIEQVGYIYPDGAFYLMMDISNLVGKVLYGSVIKDADDFSSLFLDKGLVATVPCTGFGAPNHVRWSYATSLENIKIGLDRLEKFLNEG